MNELPRAELEYQNRKSLELIRQIPDGFKCKDGCATCCKTAITVLRGVWELRLLPLAEELLPEDKTVGILYSDQPDEQAFVQLVDERGWCPFLNSRGTKCIIYELGRPIVCHEYGQHWTLFCAEGVPCPPELEVSEDFVEELAVLMGLDRSRFVDREAQRTKRERISSWRQRFGHNPDATPRTPEQIRQYESL